MRRISWRGLGLGIGLTMAVAWGSAPAGAVNSVYRYLPEPDQPTELPAQLASFSREAAGRVYYQLLEEGERALAATLAVVVAVPLADLKRETELGRLVAEYLLTDLADRGLRVQELRLGREILVVPRTGEFILSRNVGELAHPEPAVDYAVLSTFSNTRKALILQGRLVELRTGRVAASWRHELPLSRDILVLCRSSEPPFTVSLKAMP
ncbi:MAG: FlgO family outer membrane protein [Thermodesulfobacteriota bacterium]